MKYSYNNYNDNNTDDFLQHLKDRSYMDAV